MKKTLKTQVLDFIQSLHRPVTRGEIIQFYQEKIKNHKYNATEDRGLLSFQLNCGTDYILPGDFRRPTASDNRYLVRTARNTWELA